MFLCDEFVVKDYNDIFFNKDIYRDFLKINMANSIVENTLEFLKQKNIQKYDIFIKEKRKEKYKNMPNIFIYGKPGCGKDNMVNCLLENIYGKDINDMSIIKFKIDDYANKSEIAEIYGSNYHIVIEPKSSGLDKYIIQKAITNLASKKNIFSDVVDYKTVVIKNVDDLTYYTQTSLRYIMERYYKTCRFILTGKSLTSVLEPIVSRCLKCRVPNPSQTDLFIFISYINIKKNLNINLQNLLYISKIADGNVKKCLWWLENLINKTKTFKLTWQDKLDNFIVMFMRIYKDKILLLPNNIKFIRNLISDILSNNTDPIDVIKVLLNKIIDSNPNYSLDLYIKITDCFCYYERRFIKVSRDIIQFDALIFNLCNIFYLEEK